VGTTPTNVTAETLVTTLEKLTYGGEALGRLPSGCAVFVPFALPGERVQVKLKEQKRGFARAELLEVLEPSPQRIAARCKHYGNCGGCHYQHMPHEVQLEAKRDILRDQLERISKIADLPVRPPVPSPAPWNYRNHMQFHLTEDGKLGYVNLMGKPFAISECHLPIVSINSLWPLVKLEKRTNIKRLSIRTGRDDELMLVLESDSPETPELETEAGISIVHTFENHTAVISGSDHVTIRILDRDFFVSPTSFFQVNTAMAEKMVAYLLDNLPLPCQTILDLYCGVGLFSAFLAPRCDRLIGIESSPSTCDDFALNLDEFDHVELYQAPAEQVLPSLDVKPDVILVDPPRAGLDNGVLSAILALRPKAFAYVSCDPSTLARDAKRLAEGGYHLGEVTPFDLFPQTYHIESISIFTIEPKKPGESV
jgi:23S rRNA (uracil1939-C5)-methyltransferase